MNVHVPKTKNYSGHNFMSRRMNTPEQLKKLRTKEVKTFFPNH